MSLQKETLLFKRGSLINRAIRDSRHVPQREASKEPEENSSRDSKKDTTKAESEGKSISIRRGVWELPTRWSVNEAAKKNPRD